MLPVSGFRNYLVFYRDDEESIRALIENWLIRSQHAVVSTGSATEAIAALKQRSFDLVITDVLMPDGDGLDLICLLYTSDAADE